MKRSLYIVMCAMLLSLPMAAVNTVAMPAGAMDMRTSMNGAQMNGVREHQMDMRRGNGNISAPMGGNRYDIGAMGAEWSSMEQGERANMWRTTPQLGMGGNSTTGSVWGNRLTPTQGMNAIKTIGGMAAMPALMEDGTACVPYQENERGMMKARGGGAGTPGGVVNPQDRLPVGDMGVEWIVVLALYALYCYKKRNKAQA